MDAKRPNIAKNGMDTLTGAKRTAAPGIFSKIGTKDRDMSIIGHSPGL